jgi:hypothetical protein
VSGLQHVCCAAHGHDGAFSRVCCKWFSFLAVAFRLRGLHSAMLVRAAECRTGEVLIAVQFLFALL